MSLDRLLGTWAFRMEHVAFPGEQVVGEHRVEPVLDGAFVLQRTTYDHPDVPDAWAMLDDKRCHYFDVRGVIRVFDSAFDSSSWSLVRHDTDFWQRSRMEFTGPDAMEGTGDISKDEGTTWDHDYAVTWTRLPGR